MGDSKVMASAFPLPLLLHKVVEVNIFRQEIYNAGMADSSREACIINGIGFNQAWWDVFRSNVKKAYAIIQTKRREVVQDEMNHVDEL